MIQHIFSPRTVFGGMLLVAGSCIGAGLLALPIITGIGGFFSSLVLIVLSWAFMTITGLLILEVSSSFTERVNIVSMAARSFGFIGKIASWTLYLVLFYSLIVAYIVGTGNILSSSLHQFISQNFASLFCTCAIAVIVFYGTSSVDFFNKILMIGLILSYLGLIFLGLKRIQLHNLTHFNFEYSLFSFPILIASFSYHNIIPTIVSYMYHDMKKVRLCIIGGTTITLVIYLLWQVVVLGMLSFENLFSSYSLGLEYTQIIIKFLKSSWTSFFIRSFAFFAIMTSFLIQSTGLMHFWADGLHVYPSKKVNWWLLMLTLLPPFFFSINNPHVFFKAVNFVGGFCSILLFCILPICMVWKGRYMKVLPSTYRIIGGKILLIILLAFSIFVFIQELFRIFGY
jgi:tyrosine-specific transport protein